MARRRSHRRHKVAHHQNGVMKWAHKLIAPAAFSVALVGQVTAKDIAGYPNYSALPNVEKGKFLANSMVSHFTGFSPYSQYGSPGITINPTGPINKYTGMGVGLMILGTVMPKKVGGKGLALKAGKGLFWGGLIGGFFDPGTGNRGGSVRGGLGGTNAIGARAGTGQASGAYVGANNGY